MMRVLILILCLFLSFPVISADRTQRLVLVTSSESDIDTLTNKDIKRAFLGLPLKKNGVIVEPVRNHSDSFGHEVFLQNVIVMSSRIYERQLTTRVLRRGNKRPASETSHKDLLAHLIGSENSISYMWENEAKKESRIKVIQPLWSATK